MLGWLQGGGLAGSVEGTEGRGRDRVLAIINERVKVDGEAPLFSLLSKSHGKKLIGLSFFFSLAVPGPPLPSSSRTHGLAAEYSSFPSLPSPPAPASNPTPT